MQKSHRRPIETSSHLPSFVGYTLLFHPHQDLEKLAKELNPIIGFYDPLNLAEAEFWYVHWCFGKNILFLSIVYEQTVLN